MDPSSQFAAQDLDEVPMTDDDLSSVLGSLLEHPTAAWRDWICLNQGWSIYSPLRMETIDFFLAILVVMRNLS